jgi:hypothetical protein
MNPFLDVKVKKIDGRIVTEVYRKPTDSGQYLHFDSNHPRAIKTGVINTLLHRAETHCTTATSRQEEELRVEKILSENSYPRVLIQNGQKKRKKNRSRDVNAEKPTTTLCIPYVPMLSEKIRRIDSKVNVWTVFSSRDTLRSRLVKVNDLPAIQVSQINLLNFQF